MASVISIHRIQPSLSKIYFKTTPPSSHSLTTFTFQSCLIHKRISLQCQVLISERLKSGVSKSAATVTETKGFVDEMRKVSMKLHTKEQAKEGEKKIKQPEDHALSKWDLSIEGLLSFLVESKTMYHALEQIIDKAHFPFYAELKNGGLEVSKHLAKDLEWLKEQGYSIPQPSFPGANYARYLEKLSENDPHAFICHFYNIYFAHTAGGRMIGNKVSEKLLNNKVLNFYEGDLSQLSEDIRDTLNIITENWTTEEKKHCLEETGKTFEYLGKILRLLMA